MSELGDMYNEMRADGKLRRENNHKGSIKMLDDNHVKYEQLDPYHYRVGEFDFWPSTGVYIHRPTQRKARGVFNLLRALNKAGVK